MRILFLGDIVGRPGREAVVSALPWLRRELEVDFIAANAENASGGVGLNARNAQELLAAGLDCLTTGNHVWKHKDVYDFLDREPRVLRPANYPEGAPGHGLTVIESPSGARLAVMNLIGRTYMDSVDCPFRAAERLLAGLEPEVRAALIDFHAEATSEKLALARYLDGLGTGRAIAVAGTHTHVQTSDARILPGGVAAITDAGMCGPRDSILGMTAAPIIRRFLTGLPARFEVAEGEATLEGAVFELDPAAGQAISVAAWRQPSFGHGGHGPAGTSCPL